MEELMLLCILCMEEKHQKGRGFFIEKSRSRRDRWRAQALPLATVALARCL